jgi:uncharacterized membrane protein YccC
MATNLSLHLNTFNDRVKGMNQLRQQELRLTATEANNILSDVFSLLSQIARLEAQLAETAVPVTDVIVDGGGFK